VRGAQGISRWFMLCAVPAIALAVAARQLYLSTTEDLSTWKGGGMGMFAGSDNTVARYAKLYVLAPSGQRMPLLRLTPSQEQLLQKGLWFPTESTFRALAKSIKATTWRASSDQVPLSIFNENGDRVRIDDTVRFYDLRAADPRSFSEDFNFGAEIEFWKGTYDVTTGGMQAHRARIFTFED
jgi:hypothetical protein